MTDVISRQILDELQKNGRISYRDLAEKVGLSAPAVTERIHRLERDGVITGYHAEVDPAALGFPMLAIVRIRSAGAKSRLVDELAEEMDEVVECHRVTGSESHVLRVRLRDVEHLGELVEQFWEFGDTITNIVTSTPVAHRSVKAIR